MKNLRNFTTYRAGAMQAEAYRVLKSIMTRLLKEHGLSMMQWAVLGYIYDAGDAGIRPTDLAAQLATTQAFITNTINALEAKGMLSRPAEATDNRTRVVALTPDSRQRVESIERQLRDDMKRLFSKKISLLELAQYISVLRKITKLDNK